MTFGGSFGQRLTRSQRFGQHGCGFHRRKIRGHLQRFAQWRDTPGAGPAAFQNEWETIVLAELSLHSSSLSLWCSLS